MEGNALNRDGNGRELFNNETLTKGAMYDYLVDAI
jgi:hypothetical protein